jgi:hypothetical protein
VRVHQRAIPVQCQWRNDGAENRCDDDTKTRCDRQTDQALFTYHVHQAISATAVANPEHGDGPGRSDSSKDILGLPAPSQAVAFATGASTAARRSYSTPREELVDRVRPTRSVDESSAHANGTPDDGNDQKRKPSILMTRRARRDQVTTRGSRDPQSMAPRVVRVRVGSS